MNPHLHHMIPSTLRPQCDVLDGLRSHNLVARSNQADSDAVLIKQLYNALIVASTSLDVPNKQQIIVDAIDGYLEWAK